MLEDGIKVHFSVEKKNLLSKFDFNFPAPPNNVAKKKSPLLGAKNSKPFFEQKLTFSKI